MRRSPLINIQRATLCGFALFWIATSVWFLQEVASTPSGQLHEHIIQNSFTFVNANSGVDVLECYRDVALLVGGIFGLVGALWGTRFVYLLGLSIFTLSLLVVPFSLGLRCVVAVSLALKDVGRTAAAQERHHHHHNEIRPKNDSSSSTFASPTSTSGGGDEVAPPPEVWDIVLPTAKTCLSHLAAAMWEAMQASESFHILAEIAYLMMSFVNLMFLRGCFAVLTEYIFDEDLPENVNLLLFRWENVVESQVMPVRKDSRHHPLLTATDSFEPFATPLSLTPRGGTSASFQAESRGSFFSGLAWPRLFRAAAEGEADTIVVDEEFMARENSSSPRSRSTSSSSATNTNNFSGGTNGSSNKLHQMKTGGRPTYFPPGVPLQQGGRGSYNIPGGGGPLGNANNNTLLLSADWDSSGSLAGGSRSSLNTPRQPGSPDEVLFQTPGAARTSCRSQDSPPIRSPGGIETGSQGVSENLPIFDESMVADCPPFVSFGPEPSPGPTGRRNHPLRFTPFQEVGSGASPSICQEGGTSSEHHALEESNVVGAMGAEGSSASYQSHLHQGMNANVAVSFSSKQVEVSKSSSGASTEGAMLTAREQASCGTSTSRVSGSTWETEFMRDQGTTPHQASSAVSLEQQRSATSSVSSSFGGDQLQVGGGDLTRLVNISRRLIWPSVHRRQTDADLNLSWRDRAALSEFQRLLFSEDRERLFQYLKGNTNAYYHFNDALGKEVAANSQYRESKVWRANALSATSTKIATAAGDVEGTTEQDEEMQNQRVGPQSQPSASSGSTQAASLQPDFFLTQRCMLRFLYSSKMSPVEAKRLLDSHIRMIQKMKLRDVSDEDVRRNYARGFCCLAGRDLEGRPMIWIKFRFINPSEIKIPIGIKSTWLSIDAALQDLPSIQKGVRLVYDFNNLRLNNVASARPWEFKDAISAVAFSHPSVIASVVFLDAPPLLRHCWQLGQAIVPKKLKRVVSFVETHGDQRWYEAFCDSSQLPRYLGGKDVPNADFHSYLVHRVKNDSILY
ncbi:unnamed protein product [Amoebophrya sp. A25]|nr:unnamed protein product [Amoebophrya sp. A25]|eukprot:GSA25T00023465001.1